MPAKKTTKSAKSSKNQSFVRKVHKAIMDDITASVMIGSLILNMFFLVAIVLYHTSGSFEQKVFNYAQSHFCDDWRNGVDKKEYDLKCAAGQFRPFYEKAVTDYQDLLKRQNY